MNVIDCEQGTAEWKAARAGHVTASRIADVLAKIKTGEAAARRDYKAQLVAEILIGAPQEDVYTNKEMQWGTDQEPFARSAYEVTRDVLVETVGFVLNPTIERSGASPDGLVGDDGLVEIKCPKTATHLQYLLDGVVPAQYKPQMTWQMACTGRLWVDFVSYDPRLPEPWQLFIRRYERDNALIAKVEDEVRIFNSEVEETVTKLTSLCGEAARNLTGNTAKRETSAVSLDQSRGGGSHPVIRQPRTEVTERRGNGSRTQGNSRWNRD